MTSSEIFRGLHRGTELLLLPNAWDAGSARLFESVGAKAIATTSAGVAWSRGYPDGDALPQEQTVAVARDLARVIRVPLTVDIEAGYSDDPAKVAQVVTGIVEAGAVGINIEDGAGSPDLLCAKIAAAKQAAARAQVDLFINVRTDVYLRGLASGEAAVEEVVRRARRYREAGGDGLFVPVLADGAAIKAIAAAVEPMPVNIMLVPGLPTFDVLRGLGVRRLSAGAAIAQSAFGLAQRLARDFLAGSCGEMFATAIDYGATNRLFQRTV